MIGGRIRFWHVAEIMSWWCYNLKKLKLIKLEKNKIKY